jgi:predicted TIM-barrel fold metal-dependent hydrolase
VIVKEAGVTWLPWIVWGLDSHYEILRRENPKIKKRPSEYLRQHMRLTTQPLEISDDREELITLLDAFGGMEDLLCFATDYPHWDGDDPLYIQRRIPKSWHEKVFYENGREFFGVPRRAPSRARAGGGSSGWSRSQSAW